MLSTPTIRAGTILHILCSFGQLVFFVDVIVYWGLISMNPEQSTVKRPMPKAPLLQPSPVLHKWTQRLSLVQCKVQIAKGELAVDVPLWFI